MMKHTLRQCQTPPLITVRIKPSTAASLRVRRGLRLKRPNAQDAQGPPGKSHPSQHPDELYNPRLTLGPTLVIQREEMIAFLRLFDDDMIQDFLWMDCCCKITDKYLLAMTFVYFKRARFSIREYNRMHFFIALYLANTMEEDVEENKYEIFPWALGKSWRKHFPHFLKQRDQLWARIDYRAAVSRHSCDEVMALMPSHFVWQRERAEHHSGAQRHYDERAHARMPHGPLACPAPCALCDRGPRLARGRRLSSSSSGFSVQTSTSPLPFALTLTETSPPRAKASRRKVRKTKHKAQAQPSSRCCDEYFPRKESACGSTNDPSMDWINMQ